MKLRQSQLETPRELDHIKRVQLRLVDVNHFTDEQIVGTGVNHLNAIVELKSWGHRRNNAGRN